jgi:MFS family permease
MTVELMQDFNISAAALGNLSGFYFYSYVAMQIPTGIMVDTWGPRRLLAGGAFIAGIGTAMFAMAPNLMWAGIGRLLIGGSVAVAWVAILKLASSWFPIRQFAMMSGVGLLVGIIGAVTAGTPLRWLVSLFGWRSAILASAVFMLVVAALVWVYVRDYPHEKGFDDYLESDAGFHRQTFGETLKGIPKVFGYRNVLLLFVIPAGMIGSILTFSGLWGVPFLTTHYGLSKPLAAALTSTLMVALAIGGPAAGWLSDRVGRRKPLYLISMATVLLGWILIIFVHDIPFYSLVALLIIIGFCSGVVVISFAFAKETVPASLAGTVVGVVNTGLMTGPMLLQPAVGWVLDTKWEGQFEGGVRIYGMEAFQSGFSLMLAWLGLSLILLLFTRETHCRQVG